MNIYVHFVSTISFHFKNNYFSTTLEINTLFINSTYIFFSRCHFNLGFGEKVTSSLGLIYCPSAIELEKNTQMALSFMTTQNNELSSLLLFLVVLLLLLFSGIKCTQEELLLLVSDCVYTSSSI